MPLLDIAISQPCSCFRDNILAFRSETNFHKNKLIVSNDKGLGSLSRFSWKTLYIPKQFNSGKTRIWQHRLTINAVATLEVTSLGKEKKVKAHLNELANSVQSAKPSSSTFNLEPQASGDDSTEVDEREKLRRMRISKANKGNKPWNLGKKHSPETLRLIKERTRLAMQNPKVKMKLVNLGHAQSEETRVKIGVGVRLGWERRREKVLLQENCHYEWQNLVAVSARKGLFGEGELEWDSYEKLNKELEKEWVQSVEQRKTAPRPKGSKRAPKSAEQKKKIAAAIAAKWADPDYRNRVCNGLAKFHGNDGIARKPRRKPSGNGQTQRTISPKKKGEDDDSRKQETKPQIQVQWPKPKRSKAPFYRDPQANTKLEMLKRIRAQRAAPFNKNSEVITRTKLLIAEAEKAAEALEIPAMTSPVAQASLLESRKLIAEALQVIESIESKEEVVSSEEERSEEDDLSDNSIGQPSHVEEKKEEVIDADVQNQKDNRTKKVNGVHSLLTDDEEIEDFSFDKLMSPYMEANGNAWLDRSKGALETKEKLSFSNGFLQSEPDSTTKKNSKSSSNLVDRKPPSPNGNFPVHKQKLVVNGLEIRLENGEQTKQVKMIKKWVRGRLVEVAEEED